MKPATSPVLRAARLLSQIHERICNKHYSLRTEHAYLQGKVATELGKLADELRNVSVQTFGKVDDMVRNAAHIPADRDLSLEQIQATCSNAFEQILHA